MTANVQLREVVEGDLPAFFEHQRDPEACRMAAFPPRERDVFMAHWQKIIANDGVTTRTILVDDEVAGNIACYEQSGMWMIGYWLGRPFWGRGVASRALVDFVSQIPRRPLHAYVAKSNVASIRVLEKCGFTVSGEEHRSAAPTGGEVVDEFLYTLA